MSLKFPFVPVPLKGPPGKAATHPSGATRFWRPFVPIRLIGPASSQLLPQALVDSGSQDCVFPWDVHTVVGATLRPDAGHIVRWRGTAYPLRFGDIELELADNGETWRWPALVGFSPAPLPYALLGSFGCLQYMDTTFLGAQLALKLEMNAAYPGTETKS